MGGPRVVPVVVAPADPSSPPAIAMTDALWDEIQNRYGFAAPNPYDPEAFSGPGGDFWLATDTGTGDVVGSIALTPLPDGAGEPQPEALRFYAAAGFFPIEPFGRWIGDDTARCFEKTVE